LASAARKVVGLAVLLLAVLFVPSAVGLGQQAKLTASDGGASDRFGGSVAISGDTAVVGSYTDDVGANTNQGSAYVYARSGTVWTEQANLTARFGATEDYFGTSVAISGDTAVVGAQGDDVAETDQGSAYVFTRSGTVWTQQAKLTASDGAAFDYFGFSVALSGDTVVVGSHNDDVGANTDQGSAYVFTRSGTVWTQQAKLTARFGAASDLLGYSVGLSGDTAVVGAYGADVDPSPNQGSAYLFTRSGTVWTQQAKLTANDGVANDFFGFSVALNGDTVLVSAVGTNTYQGSAYLFMRSGTVWAQQAKLTASDGAAWDEFGSTVALSGNTAVVGARLDDTGTNTDQGSAYLFTGSGTVWTEQTKLTANDGAADDQFGAPVALSGGTAIVGAWLDDTGANTDQGSAYVYAAAPTAVGVRSTSAVRTERGVLVRWRTAGEVGVLGYRVYRQRGSARVPVGALVAARATLRGRGYAFLDRRAPQGGLRYWLRIVRLDGSGAWVGLGISR